MRTSLEYWFQETEPRYFNIVNREENSETETRWNRFENAPTRRGNTRSMLTNRKNISVLLNYFSQISNLPGAWAPELAYSLFTFPY